MFASDSEFSKTSSDVEQFPKCTSDWDCHFVDKLCVKYKQEDIIRIISSEWALFHLYEEDHLEIERCLNACDLKLNYESLEDIAPDTTTPIEKFVKGWEPNQLQLRVMQTEPLLEKYFYFIYILSWSVYWKFVQTKGHAIFQRGDNSEIVSFIENL